MKQSTLECFLSMRKLHHLVLCSHSASGPSISSLSTLETHNVIVPEGDLRSEIHLDTSCCCSTHFPRLQKRHLKLIAMVGVGEA